MTDPVSDSKPPTRWLWVALIVLLAVAAIVLVFNPSGDPDPESVAAEDAGGSELIVTEPTPGAAPVDLPDTPVERTAPENGDPAEAVQPAG